MKWSFVTIIISATSSFIINVIIIIIIYHWNICFGSNYDFDLRPAQINCQKWLIRCQRSARPGKGASVAGEGSASSTALHTCSLPWHPLQVWRVVTQNTRPPTDVPGLNIWILNQITVNLPPFNWNCEIFLNNINKKCTMLIFKSHSIMLQPLFV